MWQNLALLFSLMVAAVGGFACPVQGQALSGEMIWQFGTNDQVLAVALSEDGLFGATVTGEKVYLFDENGTKLWSYPVSCGRSVAISSGGEHIAAGGDHLLLFDRSGEVLRRYMPASRVQGIAIAADGQAIYAGTGAGLQVFFPESDQTAASAAWSSGTKDPIRSVSIDKEGSGVVAAGESGNIYFFSGEGQLLWNYKTGSNGIRAVISHDGLAVAAVSSQRTMYLLNRHGRLLWKSPMDGRAVDISLSGDGSTLVLAGEGISVLGRDGETLWKGVPGEEIRCVSASPDMTRIITGALDGTVSVFRLQPETPSVGSTLSQDAAATIEPLQTSVAPDPGRTARQQGALLPLAPLVTVNACVVALIWWRREKQ